MVHHDVALQGFRFLGGWSIEVNGIFFCSSDQHVKDIRYRAVKRFNYNDKF